MNPKETIGRAILRLGVYDLCVSESICRLLDPGESAIDVGANLGYMTSLMAAKAGKCGSVESFEPHPDLMPNFWVTLIAGALTGSNGRSTCRRSL